MKHLLLLCFLVFSIQSRAQALTEGQKVDQLISYIRNLPDAVFIRNGSEHSAAEAADHLQRKRKEAGNKIKTANDFITKVASRSSMSGKPYMIRLKGSKEVTCESLLRAELARLEKK